MDVTSTAATPTTTAKSPTTSGVISSDFETFLVMLTTQMQNQDPLNPIESSDYAVQLATFSGVEQQVQTNSLLQNLASQLSLMGMAQLAGWVGMEARTSASAYFDGSPITLAPQPAPTADRTMLVVYDERGTEVQRSEIPVSTAEISWNGVSETGSPLLDGSYTFKLENYSFGELLSSVPVEGYTKIAEARSENGQIFLVLAGGAKVSSDSVTALRAPHSN